VKVGGVRRGWGEFDASYAACSPRALSIWIIRVPGFSPALYSIKSTVSAVPAFTKTPAIDLVNGQRARSMSLNSGLLMQSCREHIHRDITCCRGSLPAFM